MELRKEKLVRLYANDKRKNDVLWRRTDPLRLEKSCPQYKASSLGKPDFKLPIGSKLSDGSKLVTANLIPQDHKPWQKRILDPGSRIISRWNRVFLVSCLLSLFVDPLYFYLPGVGGNQDSWCIKTDLNLQIVATTFRTLTDLFYIMHVGIKLRTAYLAPSSGVFGRGELVMDPKKIARRYIRTDFFVDLIATLPLPQIVIWFVGPAARNSPANHNNNALALIVLLQYIPRLYLIFPLSSELIKTTGVVMKTAYAGAAYNLILYMLASHVFGAAWYLLSIERHVYCWKSICKTEQICEFSFLDCSTVNLNDRKNWANLTYVFKQCTPDSDLPFNFIYGIFGKAVKKNVVSSSFLHKYFYCLWWGLQQLSSYGQNLTTSTFIGETLFAVLIAIAGLVLSAHLIGNMQTCLQSITKRLVEWRLRQRDTEEWMRRRQLPQDMRKRVRCFVQYKWVATRGVQEDAILHDLPADLCRDIQRHLCLDLVRRVPFFSSMDNQLLDAICDCLVSSLRTKGTYIMREGDTVTEMFFIMRGKLESSTTSGFLNSITMRPGDYCGEELLAWALHPKSTVNLPSSTRTVRSITEVEAFALRAVDLKSIANQFRRLHSKKLQDTFRYYSHHWRTRAACFIQAAWRRHKRKMARELSITESLVGPTEYGQKSNVVVKALVSRFDENLELHEDGEFFVDHDVN